MREIMAVRRRETELRQIEHQLRCTERDIDYYVSLGAEVVRLIAKHIELRTKMRDDLRYRLKSVNLRFNMR